MIDVSKPNEWQRRDPNSGLVMPWYTSEFLDELLTWDLKHKGVKEIGMGASTLWWESKCMFLQAWETSKEWYNAVKAKMKYPSGAMLTSPAELISYITGNISFDIVIIDCEPVELRDKCVSGALNCLKPGGKLIFDNWMQPSLGWLPSKETQQLLLSMEHKIYHQPGHPDWKTLVVSK